MRRRHLCGLAAGLMTASARAVEGKPDRLSIVTLFFHRFSISGESGEGGTKVRLSSFLALRSLLFIKAKNFVFSSLCRCASSYRKFILTASWREMAACDLAIKFLRWAAVWAKLFCRRVGNCDKSSALARGDIIKPCLPQSLIVRIRTCFSWRHCLFCSIILTNPISPISKYDGVDNFLAVPNITVECAVSSLSQELTEADVPSLRCETMID